ncbi:MAG: non-ribosomal peptide synthetase, partial [bacterium]|nr:non-ribosomal peptide synthetase [bacterium]
FAAPADPSEELLAEIWAVVLGRDRVGVHDNFFELGGHSLLATQVVSRIRETFAVEPALQRLFEAPTVAELAAVVRALREEQQGLVAPPMERIPRVQGLPRDPVPVSLAQQRLWFLDQFEPGSPLYNIPHAVRLGGAVSATVLARVFQQVVRRHEVLRTTFPTVEGRPRQVIAAEIELSLPVVDLERLPERQREAEALRLATEEARLPFDLVRGPLLRVTLVRLAAADAVLLMSLHHIVSDGWSMGVLIREVAALYAAFAAGGNSPPAELAVQYADFSVWQRQWLSGEVLDREVGYWK